jgi:hypothetical protein
VRSITSVTALAVAATLMTTSISWAGSAGRRNTALATTALAVGAWTNHTGRAGRKNTAILATAGAAVAWSRYSSKKREENRRNRYARVASRCVPVAYGEGRRDHGRHLGWYKHHGHHDGDGDREGHGRHGDRDD